MELSEAYRFCPRCGRPRQANDIDRPFRCQACHYTSFFGPVTAVGAVITNELGQVLLIERAKDPGKGLLGMPGGFIDQNETAEFAARREILEEVGISVEELTYLMTAPNEYIYQGIVNPVIDIFFHSKVASGQAIKAESSEVSAWIWTDLNAGILDRLAFRSNRLALEKFMQLS
jgi:ADP-ribose pyrophosphatase